jgi:hypothetical protein
MTQIFEPGSKVIRISGNYMNTYKGGIYTVTHQVPTGISLEGHEGTYDDKCFQLYIEPKKMTMDVIHEIVIIDKDLEDMRNKLELLQISIDNRQLQLDTLKKEYGVV